MQVKNILFITHSSLKGGAEQSLIHLINQIDIKKYSIYFVSPPKTDYLSEIIVPMKNITLSLHSIKKSLGISYLYTVIQLIIIVKKYKINIVHANGWRAPWFVFPLKYLTRAKIVWHHRDTMNSKMYNVILPFFFDKVICISKYVKSTLDNKFSEKYKVIYNGIDDTHINLKTIRGKKTVFTILAVGRIVRWKRFDYIIKAVEKFNEMHPNNRWILDIIGDTSIDGSKTYYNYLRNLVDQYSLNAHVKFLGYKPDPQKYMGKSDVTINFSDCEPFGRVIIESISVGTPVIVANSGGAPEIIKATGGGWICENGDINDLARKIDIVYKMNENDYQELSLIGRQNALTKFNMKNIYLEVEKVYKELLI